MKVIFVCIHNSGRSQMAEAFANRLGGGKITAESAGTDPARRVDPKVTEVMAEIGYDLHGNQPKSLNMEMVDSADKIITMGCDVDAGTCPASFVPSEDWGIKDPKGLPLEELREIRDDILAKVRELVRELTSGPV